MFSGGLVPVGHRSITHTFSVNTSFKHCLTRIQTGGHLWFGITPLLSMTYDHYYHLRNEPMHLLLKALATILGLPGCRVQLGSSHCQSNQYVVLSFQY